MAAASRPGPHHFGFERGLQRAPHGIVVRYGRRGLHGNAETGRKRARFDDRDLEAEPGDLARQGLDGEPLGEIDPPLGKLATPPMLDIVSTWPQRCARSSGRAAWMTESVPNTWVSKLTRASAGTISSAVPASRHPSLRREGK